MHFYFIAQKTANRVKKCSKWINRHAHLFGMWEKKGSTFIISYFYISDMGHKHPPPLHSFKHMPLCKHTCLRKNSHEVQVQYQKEIGCFQNQWKEKQGLDNSWPLFPQFANLMKVQSWLTIILSSLKEILNQWSYCNDFWKKCKCTVFPCIVSAETSFSLNSKSQNI